MISMNAEQLQGKKVVLAPFSTESIFLYHLLKKEGVEIVGFMDKDKNLHSKSYLGTMIIPYFHFAGEDIIAIVARGGFTNSGLIKEELIKVNYEEHEIISQEDIKFNCSYGEIINDINLEELARYKNLFWIRLLKEKIYKYGNSEGLKVEVLKLIITTRCSLKCEGCCALMDYYKPIQQKDAEFEDTVRAFDLVMNNLDYVGEVTPIGGEPFLYSKLDELLCYIAESPYTRKIGRVLLITNGTIVPKESTLKILQQYSDLFLIRTTDYGTTSSKRLKLVKMLNEYGCCYENHVHGTWYLTNQPIIPSENLTEAEISEKCEKCDCRKGGRIIVVENKIYSCHFLAYATGCNAIPDNKNDYIDINVDKIEKKELAKFIYDIHPGMAYCSNSISKDTEVIPKGRQIREYRECKRYE